MLDVTAGQKTSARPIRLVIADRQPIVLQGLRSVFAAQQDFEIVALCSSGPSCLEAIRNLAPDVALLADSLPSLTVSEILAVSKAENLFTRLVFFAESESDGDLAAAITAGACIAISRYANPETMLRSLRLITERHASPHVSPNGREVDGAKIEKMMALLTDRERQIVRLVSVGISNKEIARRLSISYGTVKVHIHNIFQKLGVTNRTVLATIALLQRPAGFGTFVLAAFAFALWDDLKALEAKGIFQDDDKNADEGLEHPNFDIWARAILRHVIPVDSGEIRAVGRASFDKATEVTNSAARMNAERTVLPGLGRGYGAVGSSSTTNLFVSPLLQAINNSQVGNPTPQQPLSPLQFPSSWTNSRLGTFSTAAAALIYALDHAHAASQSLVPGEALVDSSTVVAIDGITKAPITFHGAHKANHDVSASHSKFTLSDATSSAHVWTMPSDDDLRFHFGCGGNHFGVSARLAWFGDNSADADEGSVDAAGLSSSVDLADTNSAMPAKTFKPESASADALSTEHGAAHAIWARDPFEPSMRNAASSAVVPVDVIGLGIVLGRGDEQNGSLHASQVASAKAAAAEPAETGRTPGNGAGHGSPGSPSLSSSASAIALVKPVETAAGPDHSAGQGNSQHTSQVASADTAASGSAEPSNAPNDSAGHGSEPHASSSAAAQAPTNSVIKETGDEPEQSPTDASSHPSTASAMATAGPSETGGAPEHNGSQDNPQQPSQSAASTATDAGQPSGVPSETGFGQNLAFHFGDPTTSATSTTTIEQEIHSDGPALPLEDVKGAVIVETGTAAADDHAASTGQHHVKPILLHDLLI